VKLGRVKFYAAIVLFGSVLLILFFYGRLISPWTRYEALSLELLKMPKSSSHYSLDEMVKFASKIVPKHKHKTSSNRSVTISFKDLIENPKKIFQLFCKRHNYFFTHPKNCGNDA